MSQFEIDRTGRLSIGGESKFEMGQVSAWGGIGGSRIDWSKKPQFVWYYDCECGERHQLAMAAEGVLSCFTTGEPIHDVERFGTEKKLPA